MSKLYEVSIDELLKGGPAADENTAEGRRHKKIIKLKQDAWGAIGSVIAIILFFILGFLYHSWYIAWIVFLIIPIFYYIPIITGKK